MVEDVVFTKRMLAFWVEFSKVEEGVLHTKKYKLIGVGCHITSRNTPWQPVDVHPDCWRNFLQ
jgi:hypothetical protein